MKPLLDCLPVVLAAPRLTPERGSRERYRSLPYGGLSGALRVGFYQLQARVANDRRSRTGTATRPGSRRSSRFPLPRPGLWC